MKLVKTSYPLSFVYISNILACLSHPCQGDGGSEFTQGRHSWPEVFAYLSSNVGSVKRHRLSKNACTSPETPRITQSLYQFLREEPLRLPWHFEIISPSECPPVQQRLPVFVSCCMLSTIERPYNSTALLYELSYRPLDSFQVPSFTANTHRETPGEPFRESCRPTSWMPLISTKLSKVTMYSSKRSWSKQGLNLG